MGLLESLQPIGMSSSTAFFDGSALGESQRVKT